MTGILETLAAAAGVVAATDPAPVTDPALTIGATVRGSAVTKMFTETPAVASDPGDLMEVHPWQP